MSFARVPIRRAGASGGSTVLQSPAPLLNARSDLRAIGRGSPDFPHAAWVPDLSDRCN
jgi:hypothetical protein